MDVPRATGCGVLAWVKRTMARSGKSFSDLQRQSIGDELARREADSRKQALGDWQTALDDAATAPQASKPLPTDR